MSDQVRDLEEAWADIAYQAVSYRVETHGETPEQAAAAVEAYICAQIGVEVRVAAMPA